MPLTKLNLNGILELDLNLEGSTTATLTSPGVVEVDNTLPIATTSSTGVVKPDGTTITIDPDGTIHAVGGTSSWGNGEAAFTVPVLSAFTQDNFGTYTSASLITPAGFSCIRLLETTSSNAVVLRNLLMSISTPTSPWTVTMRVRAQSPTPNFIFGGLVIKDSVSGKYVSWMVGNNNSWALVFDQWNSATSSTGSTNYISVGHDAWLRIKFDGTNLLFQWSVDGTIFFTINSTTKNAFLPNNANMVGFGIVPDASTPPVFDCFSFSLTQP